MSRPTLQILRWSDIWKYLHLSSRKRRHRPILLLQPLGRSAVRYRSQSTSCLSETGKCLDRKSLVIHAVKTFSIRLHQQYYLYKLKLKCCGESVDGVYALQDEGVAICGRLENIRAPNSCVNPLTSTDCQ